MFKGVKDPVRNHRRDGFACGRARAASGSPGRFIEIAIAGEIRMTIRTGDMLAIGQVMARYCRGIDRLDAELVAGVYWPEGYDDHGPFKGSGDEFTAWIIPAMAALWTVSSHVLGQSHFEFR